MIATAQRKGSRPFDHEAACVTFDDHTGPSTPKDYWYWVPGKWKVKTGDKLQVIVSERSAPKRVTVRSVCAAHCLSAEAMHKVAAAHIPVDRRQAADVIADMKVHADESTSFDQMDVYRQAFANAIRTGRMSGAPFNSNIPKETTMKIETATFVNGQRVDQLTEDQLFDIIAKEEAAMKSLQSIVNKPQKLKDRINKMQADIDHLITLIDGK